MATCPFSGLDLPPMTPPPKPSNLVVKVKYGDSLKRFSVSVYKNSMDLNMMSLRMKIIHLFQLKLGAELALTYVDEDSDAVALDTDDELYDAVILQRLNPLRIFVQLPSNTSPEPVVDNETVKSTTACPQQTDKLLHSNSVVGDVVNSIFGASGVCRDSVSKVAPVADIVDLVSKPAVSTAAKPPSSELSWPPLVPIASPSENNITREFWQSHFNSLPLKTYILDPDQRPVRRGNVSAMDYANWRIEQLHSSPQRVKLWKAPLDKKLLKGKVHTPVGLKNSRDLVTEQCEDSSKPHGSGNEKMLSLLKNLSKYDVPTYKMHNAPMMQTPLPGSSPICHPYSTASIYYDNTIYSFHKNAICDGCEMFPIIGTRFKSKVKANYDLCESCYLGILGCESDYTRIESKDSASYLQIRKCFGAYFTPGCSRRSPIRELDSCFLEDVTVSDRTVMPPSTTFTKIWKMRNDGSSRWPYGTELVWDSGDHFLNESATKLEIPIDGHPAGKEIDISVDFTSPSEAGSFISHWRLKSPSGKKFGDRIWVSIEVEPDYATDNFPTGLNLNYPPKSTVEHGSKLPKQTQEHLEASATILTKSVVADMEEELPKYPKPASNDAAPQCMPEGFFSSSYPVADRPASPPKASVKPEVPSTEAATAGNDVMEQALIKELEELGFKQIELNKEVLRLNNYNLEQSVAELRSYEEWDPLLLELQEMGFCDKEKNKKLLEKNGGSISRAVKDLIREEQA